MHLLESFKLCCYLKPTPCINIAARTTFPGLMWCFGTIARALRRNQTTPDTGLYLNNQALNDIQDDACRTPIHNRQNGAPVSRQESTNLFNAQRAQSSYIHPIKVRVYKERWWSNHDCFTPNWEGANSVKVPARSAAGQKMCSFGRTSGAWATTITHFV